MIDQNASERITVAGSDENRVDHALVQAIGQGDHHALEALYRRHGTALLAYILGQVSDQALAEEVLQDVMLAVWRSAANFRGDSKVTTWLFAIARRRAISARQQAPVTAAQLSDTVAAPDPGPLEALERRADQDTLQAALSDLPADQRETLELIFYHGFSGPEAAEILGVAPGTIKSRLHRAKTALRRMLQMTQEKEKPHV